MSEESANAHTLKFLRNPFLISTLSALLLSVIIAMLTRYGPRFSVRFLIVFFCLEAAACYFTGQVLLGKKRPYYGTVGERVVLSVIEIVVLLLFSLPVGVRFLPEKILGITVIASILCSALLFVAFLVIPLLPVKFKNKCILSAVSFGIYLLLSVFFGLVIGKTFVSAAQQQVQTTQDYSAPTPGPDGIPEVELVPYTPSPQTDTYAYSMPSRSAKYVELNTEGVKRIKIYATCDANGSQLKFDLLPDLDAFYNFSHNSTEGGYSRWKNCDYLGKSYMHEIEVDDYPAGSQFYLAMKNRNWAVNAFVDIKITYYYKQSGMKIVPKRTGAGIN